VITLETTASSLDGRRLRDLGKRAGDAVGDAIARGLETMAADARANVAALRDPGRSGPSLLAASIVTEMDADGRGGVVRAGGGSAPYAAFVEFGTQRTPAQPFLGPALAANEQRIRTQIAAVLNGALGGPS
jgi:HK97 gp10 family phage protein